MAGNIPLVGFHDWLSTFITGNRAVIKTSSTDQILLPFLLNILIKLNPNCEEYFIFAERIKNCVAYIATGSNNSARYFEYYFGKYPNIIRKNRTSVAILNGNETEAELHLLAFDIACYFGRGCRNVTKIFVPNNYDFLPLITCLKKYNYFIDYNKYINNYEYNLAIAILNNQYYMSSGSMLLLENQSIFSPISVLHYEFFKPENHFIEALNSNSNIQCIVGNNHISFGQAQQPSLLSYSDGIDTIQFLSKL